MSDASRQRFKAIIHKQGPNPYVDVPIRVSLAFAGQARAGRVSVEGSLNETAVRATLVPVGEGRHCLFVNGGMRSVAGVGVGDTVAFELHATAFETVTPPVDVVKALRRVQNAEAAFEALSPSHRRELLRYVDDARTAQTRQRRVQRMVDHLLGKRPPSRREEQGRPMWTCPSCGNQFVNKNQYHSCARYELDDLFAGKPRHIRELFDRFRGMVEACGPVKTLAYRDRAGFMVRVRFAGAVPRTRWLDVGLWLPRRVESPRFHKIETLYPDVHIHVLRITDADQLDGEVARWVKEAYGIGASSP